MVKTSNSWWPLWLGFSLIVPVLLAGCMHQNSGNYCENEDGSCGKGGLWGGLRGRFDKCATIPAGAIPQPIGTHTNAVEGRQAAKAEMDQFVIYLYEWYGDTTNFGPFGSRHIERIAARLPKVKQFVVIEPDRDPGVNEARRVTAVAYLEQHGNPNAAQLVVLGYPQAEGLYGDEAERIYRQMIFSGVGNNYNNRNINQGNNVGGVGGYGGGGYGGFGMGGY